MLVFRVQQGLVYAFFSTIGSSFYFMCNRVQVQKDLVFYVQYGLFFWPFGVQLLV